jgi:hypothetical protein
MSDGFNLDLSGATESSFEAIPSGTYRATVKEVTMKQTKGGPEAKLPAGTPMLNVQFRIADGEYENRRMFRSYVIAPDKIKGKKNENKSVTDGILYGFLKAVGYDPDEVKSGNFQLDVNDMAGRACRIKVGQRTYQDEIQNEVKDVKPDTGEAPGANDELDLLNA